ncbi:FadR family transcriptional regulator [Mameliella alba]|nr:FadR family transcriptional regulator [Mameliella alba]MBY6160248.1 FadR family transcriptional regulator [Mameliella alba]MBY6168718.1 FadR family transcriptional regulator [Mameliella alba]MBY6174061.1 FadR family transcriptional regulator [Mameliella alba]MCA0956825.1 FadR family transcriptional regulator [Mameliella alba]
MAQQDDAGRAADHVVQSIAERIRTGALRDGQPLPPERDLMEQYGISRTVVREAVRTLSSRGLIEALPRHRPVVRKPGVDAAFDAVGSIVAHLLSEPGGVRNLFDTRIMIEAALVRHAAKEASREDIVELKAALEANGAAIEDSEEFYRTDNAFHAVLYEIPKNPVLPAIHRAYTTWLAPQWSRMPRLQDRNKANFDAHTAIFEAILMRDPDSAEARLRDHLSKAWAQVRATFGDM